MFYVLLACAPSCARGRVRRGQQPKLDALLPWWPWAPWPTWSSSTPTTAAWWPRACNASAPGRCRRACRAVHGAGRKARKATTFDFGFALGPRINAAGRLADMTLGIECLLTDDAARADELARQLDAINRERREIEGGMREQAMLMAEGCSTPRSRRRPSACSTPTSTKAWSASWPRASRTAAPPHLRLCRQRRAGQGA
jgi:single-stranded-DNA-specific exonuclease